MTVVKYCVCFIYLSFFPTLVWSQKQNEPSFNKAPVIFYSQINEAFYAFSDTTEIFEFKLSTKIWKRHTFNTNGYGRQLNLFVPMNSKHGDYFVAGGCGIVLKIIDFKLVRIDHSFDHQNQHCAQRFAIGDTLFFYGGYGLFTRKKILTYYTEKNAEWLLYPKKQYDDFFMENGNTWLIGDEVWSFGNTIFTDEFQGKGFKSRKIYCLNKKKRFEPVYELPSNKDVWGNLGVFFIDVVQPYLFDPKSGDLIKISSPWKSTINNYTIDPTNRYVIQVHNPAVQDGNWKTTVVEIKLDFKNRIRLMRLNNPKNEKLYYWYSYLLFLGFAGLIVLYFLFQKIRKKKNRKVQFHFSLYEDLLFNLLSKGEWVENQELISIVSKPNNSYEANKKRKDLQLQSLLDKIKKETGLTEEDFLEKRKDDNDKRIILVRFKMSVLNSFLNEGN